MKWQLTCFLVILSQIFYTESHAQDNSWTVKGKVLEVSRTPLEFVNVYVNNTSIGTTTKVDGSFILRIPKSIQKIELVVSFIGYNTVKKVLAPYEMNKTIIFLMETSNMLKEVMITAKRDKDWKKKWRIFKEGLLGDSQFTSNCEILNPESIRLEYDKDKNVLATADEPIFIQNNGLGYKIMFQMETFISNGKLTFFAGDKFFEKLKSKDERQENKWKKFRKRAYHDSFRNFLVSLSQNKLEENGFEIFQESNIKDVYLGRTTVAKDLKDGTIFKCRADSICKYDSLTKRYILGSDKPLIIFLLNHFNPRPVFSDYPYKFSQIVMTNGSIEFTHNGWVTKPNGMILRDYWGNEGFSNLLPDDFEGEDSILEKSTPENLASIYAENEQKFWFINGKVTDADGIPVESAEVFVNHTENGVSTNKEGRFTLKVPSALQQLELLTYHPKFYVSKEAINAKENSVIHEINLKPDNFSLLGEKNKDYQKNWKIFSRTLLGDPTELVGKTQFTESCIISNPEVVSFNYDESKKLTAKADKPLFILNNALGYIMTYKLNQFETDGKESVVKGDKFFKKLTPVNEKQDLLWKKNQQKIYQESLKYFLISLSQNRLEENGFKVFKMRKILDLYDATVTVKSQLEDSSLVIGKAKELCKFDEETNHFYLYSEYPLLVFLTKRTEAVRLTFRDYPYKRSQIVLPNFYLEFAADGTVTNYQNAEMRDFWGKEGISSSLPNDFWLDLENLNRTNFEDIEVLNPKKLSLDSTNRLSIAGIQFNRAQIEVPDEKVYGSVLTDFNVRINEIDMNLTIFDLLKRIPGLIANPEFVGFRSSTSLKGGVRPAAISIDGNFTDDPNLTLALLSSINVRDIASLGAIKYGNAAIYGARGGNGIIVITTKK
ncbi:carboxypeptidase-like regulatory domain-containing protein [Emticicia sp. BO119]|uniref:carboxypeptidase-like regulatory domain-containing protein n=1 Tax=Emticicia sp. BO119 TaxID=2757768 RepID=UPI0015F0BAD8|nr:carboxypeptidase-like regulatory domain-containing protein [Emticicia sp. BO119]MBA4850059.1 carboxypeptidase-like regulatory domain-containing protein [Emticicia sp. BO119]